MTQNGAYFAFFKFNIPSQKYDKNNSIKIIFIKIIIKTNVIKTYIEYNHFIAIKYSITRTFIKVEYIFISYNAVKSFVIILLATKEKVSMQLDNHQQLHHTFFELYIHQDSIQLKKYFHNQLCHTFLEFYINRGQNQMEKNKF